MSAPFLIDFSKTVFLNTSEQLRTAMATRMTGKWSATATKRLMPTATRLAGTRRAMVTATRVVGNKKAIVTAADGNKGSG